MQRKPKKKAYEKRCHKRIRKQLYETMGGEIRPDTQNMEHREQDAADKGQANTIRQRL